MGGLLGVILARAGLAWYGEVAAFSVAARTAREGDGRERENSCMMIDLCTDLQKTKPRLWRGLRKFHGATLLRGTRHPGETRSRR